jgi:hypothetical protein
MFDRKIIILGYLRKNLSMAVKTLTKACDKINTHNYNAKNQEDS